jgi:hypothetical protein
MIIIVIIMMTMTRRGVTLGSEFATLIKLMKAWKGLNAEVYTG